MPHSSEIRSSEQRVVVTGMGWVTPLGATLDGAWERLVAGHSGVHRTENFDTSTFPTTFSAEVCGYQLGDDLADPSPYAESSRVTQFLLGACAQAWHAAQLDAFKALDLRRVGLYLAAGEGPLDLQNFAGTCLATWNESANTIDDVKWAEEALVRFNPLTELAQEPHMALNELSHWSGAAGPAMNCLTACAASAQAIGEATEMIRQGDADVMIAGGGNSMIHPLGITGFSRLTALSTRNDSPTEASRPFDAKRDGFVIAEGSGIVILERLSHAIQRNAPIWAEVMGYGNAADGYRITDQDPESRGTIDSIQAALTDAHLSPDQIDYFNAHGTGTKENDRQESLAIRQVFGEHAKTLPVSSIKSMIGHAMTAAGVIEFISCVLAIQHQLLPPTINLQTIDPQCDLDHVANFARPANIRNALTSNAGFGGQNVALVLGKYA